MSITCGLTGHPTSPRPIMGRHAAGTRAYLVSFVEVPCHNSSRLETPVHAFAAVVPCALYAVPMEDDRRPQSVGRDRWGLSPLGSFGQVLGSWARWGTWQSVLLDCTAALVPPNATLCRRTERHHTAACVSTHSCDTASCPGRIGE